MNPPGQGASGCMKPLRLGRGGRTLPTALVAPFCTTTSPCLSFTKPSSMASAVTGLQRERSQGCGQAVCKKHKRALLGGPLDAGPAPPHSLDHEHRSGLDWDVVGDVVEGSRRKGQALPPGSGASLLGHHPVADLEPLHLSRSFREGLGRGVLAWSVGAQLGSRVE